MNQALTHRSSRGSTAITTPAPAPAGNLVAMLSLPEWCDGRVAAVSAWGQDIEKDGRRVPTIPTSLALTEAMRTNITERVATLEAAAQPGPVEHTAEAVGKMLLVYAKGPQSEAQTDAKMEAYMDLLMDLPFWAVDEAIRRWRHRNAGLAGITTEEYRWAPDPAVLASIAGRIATAPAGRAVQLRRLLSAVPYDPPTEAQREEAARLAAQFVEEAKRQRDITPPVNARREPVSDDGHRSKSHLADLEARKLKNQERDEGEAA